jgi:hypothetical protein
VIASQTASTDDPSGRDFLLLPVDADHDVKLFQGVPAGDWVDMTPPEVTNNLPALPAHFCGRNQDMHTVVQTCLRSRLASIVAPCGTGKSSLARASALYLNHRRHFDGGCFFVRLGHCTHIREVVPAIARAAQGLAPSRCIQST